MNVLGAGEFDRKMGERAFGGLVGNAAQPSCFGFCVVQDRSKKITELLKLSFSKTTVVTFRQCL